MRRTSGWGFGCLWVYWGTSRGFWLLLDLSLYLEIGDVDEGGAWGSEFWTELEHREISLASAANDGIIGCVIFSWNIGDERQGDKGEDTETDLRLQSIPGFIISNHGIPRIMEYTPIGARVTWWLEYTSIRSSVRMICIGEQDWISRPSDNIKASWMKFNIISESIKIEMIEDKWYREIERWIKWEVKWDMEAMSLAIRSLPPGLDYIRFPRKLWLMI